MCDKEQLALRNIVRVFEDNYVEHGEIVDLPCQVSIEMYKHALQGLRNPQGLSKGAQEQYGPYVPTVAEPKSNDVRLKTGGGWGDINDEHGD